MPRPSDIHRHSDNLWLSINLTHFALNIDNFRVASDNRPAVILYEGHVWQTNTAAKALGIVQGMSLNQMSLLTDFTEAMDRQPSIEKDRLEQLAYWAHGFTSTVVIYNNHTLLLEIGKSRALFKGIHTLIERLANELNNFGFDHAVGLANTPKAAYLLALSNNIPYNLKHDLTQSVESNNRSQRRALDKVELHKLPISKTQLEQLHGCGFSTLEHINSIQDRELASRFGRSFVDYLAQLYGKQADPQIPTLPPETFHEFVDFAEPIKNWHWIEQQQLKLLKSLLNFVSNRQLSCDEFSWQLHQQNGALINEAKLQLNYSTIALLPLEEQIERLYELTRLKLETLKLTADIERIELRSLRLTPIALINRDLFDNTTHQDAFEQLWDKLSNKLGHQAVYQLESREEHLPERSFKQVNRVSANDTTGTAGKTAQSIPEANTKLNQPNWLFKTPKPISAKYDKPHYKGPLDLIHGPQRLVNNWWSNLESRDYYVARQACGSLLWVFKDRKTQRWFIHGLYG